MNPRDPNHEKKIRILNAATVVLTRRGVQEFSFENVAEEAALSRQLVRYYYSDLNVLIADLADLLGSNYRDILVAGIAKAHKVKRLEFFLDFFFGLSDGNPMPDNLEAYDALVACSVGSKLLRDRMCDQYKTLGQVIMHELAIAYPQLGGRACEEISFMFVSMMHAHWSFVASLGHSREHSILARRAVERLIDSYVIDPAPVAMAVKPWTRDS